MTTGRINQVTTIRRAFRATTEKSIGPTTQRAQPRKSPPKRTATTFGKNCTRLIGSRCHTGDACDNARPFNADVSAICIRAQAKFLASEHKTNTDSTYIASSEDPTHLLRAGHASQVRETITQWTASDKATGPSHT